MNPISVESTKQVHYVS